MSRKTIKKIGNVRHSYFLFSPKPGFKIVCLLSWKKITNSSVPNSTHNFTVHFDSRHPIHKEEGPIPTSTENNFFYIRNMFVKQIQNEKPRNNIYLCA